jgi:AcrR family transcriptional regulator
MTVETQSARIARQKRAELLEAALAELVEHGWRGLQMQAVAKRVGVSRQTMYYTFSNRDGLASAMVDHLTDSFLDGFSDAFETGSTPDDQWLAGVRYLLDRACIDPALHAMLGVDSGEQFLALLTSGSAPIIARARERIPATALHHQPHLETAKVVEVAELLARLVLSQVVQPMSDLNVAINGMTEMIIGFLVNPSPITPRSGAA